MSLWGLVDAYGECGGVRGMVDWWDEKGIWWRVGSGYFLDAKQEVGWHEREDALSRF